MLIKFLLNIYDVTSEHAWSINTLSGSNFEIGIFPEFSDILVELFLKFLLLIS